MDQMDGSNLLGEEKNVSLESLAELTGFPIKMIKEELLLDDEKEISLAELRKIMLQYLDRSFKIN